LARCLFHCGLAREEKPRAKHLSELGRIAEDGFSGAAKVQTHGLLKKRGCVAVLESGREM